MEATDAPGCPAAGCFGDASIESIVPSPEAGEAQVDAGGTRNPLCGTGCNPNLVEACKEFDAGMAADAAPPPADGGGYDASSGKDSEADANAEKKDDAAGGNMGGSFGPSTPNDNEGGVPGPAYACQVAWAGETTEAVCTASGPGKAKDPCSRSSDCAAGLTCVGTLSIAQCLKYCCGADDNCDPGFYCSEEVARDYWADHPGSDPRKVPVCVPGRGCDPLDPESDPKKCDPGLSCAIVKSDGTTGCIPLPKDAAKQGESCKDVPCAEGFVCAKTTNTCMQLCHVGASDECEGGVCQGGSTNLPAGFGICVGNYDK